MSSSATPPSFIDPNLPTDRELRYKRKIDELEKEIAVAKSGALKVISTMSFINMGRLFHKIISLYASPQTLLSESDRRDELADNSDTEDEDYTPPVPTIEQDRDHRGYLLMIHYLPALKDKIKAGNLTELNKAFAEIRKGAEGARGDDTRRLREAFAKWINREYPGMVPLLDPDSRSNRGLEHDKTGLMLSPAEFDFQDDIVKVKIRNGDPEYLVTASSWPLFMYYAMHFDPSDPEKGFLRSFWLVKAYKHIFTSPHSAEEVGADVEDENTPSTGEPPAKKSKAKASSKRCVAVLIGLTKVTPRSLGYVASQVRFAISNLSHWQDTDGDFNYVDFYNNIVDFLEAPPGPLAKKDVDKLLQWWNEQIFKNGKVTGASPLLASTSSATRMVAQRAQREESARLAGIEEARRAREAEAAAASAASST